MTRHLTKRYTRRLLDRGYSGEDAQPGRGGMGSVGRIHGN